MRTQQQDQYWNTGATEVQQLNPDGILGLEYGSSGIYANFIGRLKFDTS